MLYYRLAHKQSDKVDSLASAFLKLPDTALWTYARMHKKNKKKKKKEKPMRLGPVRSYS